MAKLTHAQEVSTGTPDSYTAEETADKHAPVVIRRAMLGEVDRPLAETPDGGGSSLSTEKLQTSTESSKGNPRLPAPTMENPSDPQEKEEEVSTVPLTDGDTPKMEPPPSDEEAAPDFDTRTPVKKAVPAKRVAAKKATSRVTDFDDDDF